MLHLAAEAPAREVSAIVAKALHAGRMLQRICTRLDKVETCEGPTCGYAARLCEYVRL